MNAKIIILVGLAAVVTADSRELRGYGDSQSFESFESGDAKYNFNWAVKDDDSGNDFGHQEGRDGDNTQGSYYVHLPDGRLQQVAYQVVGDDGYIADVQYEGEARYPDSYESASFESRESPRYAPPRPAYYESNESK